MAPQQPSRPTAPAAAKPVDTPATAKPNDSPSAKPANSPAAAKRADKAAAGRRAAVRAASQLPPGLPRAHYNYRTTVAPPPPPFTCAAAARWWSRKRSTCRWHRSNGPYAPRLFGTPLLPGSSTLPGYYGTSHSYSYDGPYYGGPYDAVLEPPALRLRRVRILLDAY